MRVVKSLRWMAVLSACLSAGTVRAGEPDPRTYWDLNQVRPGMRGTGRTVMQGTKLEEFGAEVLGVMKDVSPGRDMILCRLTGCNLEHAGIIQGMSGSPIYVEGKLLGAVAYAWEFAKDPIAGVTPFEQMVKYVRSSDRRLIAEAADAHRVVRSVGRDGPFLEAFPTQVVRFEALMPGTTAPRAASVGGLAGMRPIATPLTATGFSPRALAVLQDQMGPLGMAPMAGGGVMDEIREREGNKPLEPGSPLSIGMVLGDFDISGIGTVTHVEGDRVYGFGHPMMGLGACAFPMMTGYIHTVYPRASVSMKMGSPLKVVGVLDADVSTGIAGRVGPKPDLMPMSVTVKTGRHSDARTYRVRIVRHPKLISSLVLAVLTNAIDTEGDLPEELTAHINATIRLAGHDPITLSDTVSGPRFGGSMGGSALFSPVSSLVGILARNAFTPVRIESVDCEVAIEPGRTTAAIESVRLASDRVQPGETLKVFATLRPFKSEAHTVEVELPLPSELAEGTYEAVVCDSTTSLRRRVAAAPHQADPHDLAGLIDFLKLQAALRRTDLFVHVPVSDRGLAVNGQALPNLPGSVREVLADNRQSTPSTIKSERIAVMTTEQVVEGSMSIKFRVVKDTELSLRD